MVEKGASLRKWEFECTVVSPERTCYVGREAAVQIPTEKGDTVILVGHAPMVFALVPGIVRLREGKAANERDFFITGGFAEATNDSVKLLASSITPISAFNKKELEITYAGIQQAIDLSEDEDEKSSLNEELLIIRHQLDAVEKSTTLEFVL